MWEKYTLNHPKLNFPQKSYGRTKLQQQKATQKYGTASGMIKSEGDEWEK